jgi:2-iminobutanoate/2-iminopropanoate deaminase
MQDFALVNTIYETWLGKVKTKPARQTVEVSALPKGARVEVSCIAYKK